MERTGLIAAAILLSGAAPALATQIGDTGQQGLPGTQVTATPQAVIPPPGSPPPPAGSPATPPPLSRPMQSPAPPAATLAISEEGKSVGLPLPVDDPLAIDPAADPLLSLGQRAQELGEFQVLIQAAVERHPGTREAVALTDEARYGVTGAREGLLPTVDLTFSSYHTFAREFANDPNNIIERSRPTKRTDALLNVRQTLIDFGATMYRVDAAGARLRSAQAQAEDAADRIALGAVAAWYDVFGYRALVGLAEAFDANQQQLRQSVEIRIRDGVSAPGDLARVDSYIASAGTRLARYRRQLANAEARFTELMGSAPPASLQRAPLPGLPAMSRDMAALAAESSAPVRSAQAEADAARREARAAKADLFPNVAAGVDAGRYGIVETDKDYDVRGLFIIRQRLFGGTRPRANQAEARADSADARASRIREEAGRDAAIAWSDVEALSAQLRAVEQSYIASRRSRDVIVERFRVARGTLFDVIAAEDSYFETAASYIQTLTELDAARYVLLSRTGRLLDALAIDPERLEEGM